MTSPSIFFCLFFLLLINNITNNAIYYNGKLNVIITFNDCASNCMSTIIM